MRKIILCLPILIAFKANAKLESAIDKNCEVPIDSQWNDTIEVLSKKTEKIFLGELVSSSDGGEIFDIKSDMKVKESFSADGKRDSTGRRQTYFYNDVWKSKTWKFKISEVLKGDLKQGNEVTFTSLGWVKKPEAQQVTNMCDIVLGFDKGKKYIIFLNSFNPSGYKAVSGEKDPYLLKVKALNKK